MDNLNKIISKRDTKYLSLLSNSKTKKYPVLLFFLFRLYIIHNSEIFYKIQKYQQLINIIWDALKKKSTEDKTLNLKTLLKPYKDFEFDLTSIK